MSSFFSWLDYSESERKKVLDVVQAFGDRDTRDELGIGTVRDAYADLLAPGTSTIQTRIKYFLFVPWIHLRIEKRLRSRKTASKADVAKLIRDEEIRLINVLAESDDPDGTIGIEARKSLKRLPSSIYWSGLYTWGIRTFRGSQDQYHHTLHSYGAPPSAKTKSSEQESDPSRILHYWHQGLPPCPRDFPAGLSLTLMPEEAEYLRERILHTAAGTMLAYLVDQVHPCDHLHFPWEHPHVAELPVKIKTPLNHARNFSETINGAALIYNHMLAKKSKNEERISEYEHTFSEWAALILARRDVYVEWNIDSFWDTAYSVNQRIPSRTKNFIDSWLSLLFSASSPLALLNHSLAENLIKDRERFLKKGQARLLNKRALELWGGSAGAARLDFRWRTISTFVTDIQSASQKPEAKVA